MFLGPQFRVLPAYPNFYLMATVPNLCLTTLALNFYFLSQPSRSYQYWNNISPCNWCSAILNLNATKNDILKVDAQLSALKSYANYEFLILRNQIESFTGHTKMSLGHENSNEDALHKNIAFLQNELMEKNKKIKSQMETQTVVLNLMTNLRQQPELQSRT